MLRNSQFKFHGKNKIPVVYDPEADLSEINQEISHHLAANGNGPDHDESSWSTKSPLAPQPLNFDNE